MKFLPSFVASFLIISVIVPPAMAQEAIVPVPQEQEATVSPIVEDAPSPESELEQSAELESSEVDEEVVEAVDPIEPAEPVAITADHVPGEVIVKFKEESLNLEKRSGEALAEEIVAEATTVEALSIDETIPDANIAIVDTGALDAAEAIVALEADANVEYAEPNFVYRMEAISTDDTHRALLWALENTGQGIFNQAATTTGLVDSDIDAPEAWELSRGAGVIVAVIDTGVDYTHPDLAANMWDGAQCKNEAGEALGGCIHGYDFYRNSLDPAPDVDHGTHVAGTIAARINNAEGVIGVAPEAKIMALRADFQLNGDTVFFSSDIVRAINFARENDARVINASFGGAGFSQAMNDAIQEFGDAGGIFVAAAGNSNTNNDATPFYPANYDLPYVISVAASNQSDVRASFSNFGTTTVDIAAPGVNIYSTVPGGYGYKNGTSMAAPHVTGVVAQLMAYDADISSSTLRQAVLAGDSVAGLASSTATGKRINAYGALTSLGLATTSTLTVQVTVVNDNAGTALASDFTFSVNGGAAESVATSSSTSTRTVAPGRYHSIVGTVASGYDLTATNCTSIVIGAGDTATCTLTYNDTAPVVSSGGGGGGGGGGGSSRRGGGGGGGGSSKKSTPKTTTPAKTVKTTPAPGGVTKMPVLLPSSAPRFTIDRGVGAQGGDVSELQRMLAAKGYLGVAPTGYFGSLTADAVRRYQAANGLAATGLLDVATRAKLNAEAGASTAQTSTGTQSSAALQAQIASLQAQLASLLAQLAAQKAGR